MPKNTAKHTPLRKTFLLAAGACVLVLCGVAGGFVLLLSGSYTTAATAQHFRLTYRLLDVGLRYSLRSAANDVVVPALDRPGMLERGAACYARYCVECHGAPGVAPGQSMLGALPVPANLVQTAREWPPAWLYQVTTQGIRMTGMPAWKYRMSVESRWSTVAFLEQLPWMDDEQYLALQSRQPASDCAPSSESPVRYSAEHAKIILRQYACHSCHRIEGVVGPRSQTGPALVDWSRRKYIAGVAPNTHANLVRWIRAPQTMSPHTLMPDLQVAEAHAQEMATYLLQLE